MREETCSLAGREPFPLVVAHSATVEHGHRVVRLQGFDGCSCERIANDLSNTLSRVERAAREQRKTTRGGSRALVFQPLFRLRGWSVGLPSAQLGLFPQGYQLAHRLTWLVRSESRETGEGHLTRQMVGRVDSGCSALVDCLVG